jgi:hypothetical protein
MRTPTIPATVLNGEIISEKQQKFIALAQARVSRAIASIQTISKLSRFKPSPEHVDKIVARLREEVDALGVALESAPKFTLY